MTQSPRIKICGLKDVPTIEAMDGLPIHEIGFVFAPSKRQVSKETASRMIQAVRALQAADGKPPRTVGVFVNISLSELKSIIDAAPLDVVQLHGDETPEYCNEVRSGLGVQVWKVFSIKGAKADRITSAAEERLAPYKNAVDAILIDAPGGGTGQTFDWETINDYRQASDKLGLTLYVAGGLHEGNVQELLRAYSPGGIDVSSGVETNGSKDIDKIRLFVRRVMEA